MFIHLFLSGYLLCINHVYLPANIVMDVCTNFDNNKFKYLDGNDIMKMLHFATCKVLHRHGIENVISLVAIS